MRRATIIVLAASLSWAGKPTVPQQVQGVSPYVEEVVFAESAIPTVFSSWSDPDMERVVFQGNGGGTASVLAMDSAGTIYTLVRAFSVTRIATLPNHKTLWWGIVAYDTANETGATVSQETLVYPDGVTTYDPDEYEGKYFVGLSVVPASAGPLEKDHLLVLRRSQADGANSVEIIQIDPVTGASELLHELEGTTIVNSLSGHLHADSDGSLYLAARSYLYGSNDDGDGALLRLAWDGVSSYSEENLVPAALFIDTVATVGSDDALYTIGEPFGLNDGEILRYDDTSAAFVVHATYPQESRKNATNETSWGFAFDSTGQMWMGIYDVGKGYSGVSAVAPGQDVDFGSRIAHIPYRDGAGLAGGLNEDIYVIAGDRVSGNTVWSLYRLRKTSDPGGDGGGKGGGKGKSK